MTDFTEFLILVYVFSGFMWLRRAYVGEKRGSIISLRSPESSQMSKRERIINLAMAAMSFVIGGIGIWKVLHH